MSEDEKGITWGGIFGVNCGCPRSKGRHAIDALGGLAVHELARHEYPAVAAWAQKVREMATETSLLTLASLGLLVAGYMRAVEVSPEWAKAVLDEIDRTFSEDGKGGYITSDLAHEFVRMLPIYPEPVERV